MHKVIHMKSIIVILPYFGKFPIYFPLFLKSCSSNDSIDWLIVTDQSADSYVVPKNCIWVNKSFTQMQQEIKDTLGYKPEITYDLCKYRAAYHIIFNKYVSVYDFWGFCDCDLIFGNLRNFITENVLEKYDKISWRGHLTLIRNSSRLKDIYLTEIPGYKTFRGCVSNSDGVNLFDEVGLNKIFDYFKLPIYTDLPICDLVIRKYNFVCNHGLFDDETNKRQIFRWDNGKLFRVYLYNGMIYSQEVVYVHFLKRPMKYDESDIAISMGSSFLIVPNEFVADRGLTPQIVAKYSRNKFYWNYYKKRLKPKFILDKILSKINPKKLEMDRYELQK